MDKISKNADSVDADEELVGASIRQLDGVVIGVLVGLDGECVPLVAFAGNPVDKAVRAKSTTKFLKSDIGREVALMFENGSPEMPVVIGRIQKPELDLTLDDADTIEPEIDGERLIFDAKREIVLRCGKSSITLTRAGKVIIRGAYLLSRSSGVNRIKGGSVQIN